MSLNLGNEGLKAAAELRASPHFAALLGALEARAYEMMTRALESDSAGRVDATAYARALRDLWIALESGATGVPQRAVRQPRAAKGQPDMPDMFETLTSA